MRFYLILAFMAHVHRVHSSTLCDSDLCVCKQNKSENDDIGEVVDCSYFPAILKTNYSLPSAVFSLDLSWNNLTSVNATPILQSSTLTALYLNNNKITEIAIDALQLPQLKRLDLSNNYLEAIQKDTFQNIHNLEYLNLANNKFHSLSELSFHHLSNLNEIILDNNNLGPSLKSKNLFDRNGYGLTNKIRSLSISGINLRSVYDNFFVDAYNIRRLIISNNNLTEIFELPFTLEYLDLSDNPITEISGEDFSEMPALKELKLNNLWIEEVPAYTFAFLPGLTSLQLERNKNLTTFSELAFGQEILEDADDFALENLSVRGSRLSTLSDKLEVPFGHLIHLDLQGNLWKCDCNLKWIKRLQISNKESSHLRCYTPHVLYNSKLMEISEKYLVCQVKQHYVGVTIGVVTACVLLTAIAAWIFLYVPKNPAKFIFLKDMNMSTAGYSALPVHMGFRDAP
ncbi:unnamed protein product [Colias eurytheme]|nr:unnamed protein product [Colias eurytheme]